MIEPLTGKAAAAVHVPAAAAIVAYDGSVRSSKTITSLLAWLAYTIHGPKGALLLTGRTETAIIANIVYPLQDMLGRGRVVLNRGTGTATILGRECRIVGANDEQARTKIQGMTLAGAYLDEASNVPESFFNMLRSRLSVPGARLYLTCNPEGPKHWLLTKWLRRAKWRIHRDGTYTEDPRPLAAIGDDRSDGPLALFRATFLLDDNHYLATHNPAFVAELKASWPHGSVFYKRYILSEWASSDGVVYPGWQEDRMVIPADRLPPLEAVLIASLDYGTTHRTRGYLLGIGVAPFVDGWPDLDAARASTTLPSWTPFLIVLDEFAPGTATVGQHAAAYVQWIEAATKRFGQAPEWLAIDPAAAVFRVELHELGRSDVMRAHNAVVPGIQTVDSMIATRRLFVSSDCPELVAGIPRYEWDVKASDRGETRPVKVDDDEADALRYAVYTSRAQWRERIPLAPIPTPDDEDDTT